MNLRKSVSTALTLFVIFSVEVSIQAEEGFFLKDTLPPALSSAWDATFFLGSFRNGAINGTAFVISKRPSRYEPSTKTLATFLTADHVIQKLCGQGTGLCDVVLSASEGFDIATRDYILMDRHRRTIYEIEVFKRSAKRDLAMFWALVDRAKYESIQPIPFGNCDKLYTDEEIYLIGFPHANKRTAEGAKFIEKPERRIRRWSRGYIMERVEPGRWNKYSLSQINITADSLSGSSGGPALNQKGEFWGILSQGRQQKSKGNPYRGNSWDSPQLQSLVVECWDIEKFLAHQGRGSDAVRR